MRAYLFDDTPAAPGEKHGERGPTHCATITVDYEYQVEMWVQEIEKDNPKVVRIECPTLLRAWKRDDKGVFVEQPRSEQPKVFCACGTECTTDFWMTSGAEGFLCNGCYVAYRKKTTSRLAVVIVKPHD